VFVTSTIVTGVASIVTIGAVGVLSITYDCCCVVVVVVMVQLVLCLLLLVLEIYRVVVVVDWCC
jgi:hypothetical protein